MFDQQKLSIRKLNGKRNKMKNLSASDILSAVSHPNRIKIIKALENESVLCACEMLPKLGLEQSNLSRHLSVLAKSGILVSWKEGVRINYRIKNSNVFKIIDLAEKMI